MKKDYWVNWFLPGLAFILLAFWAGALSSMILSLAGFLSFFMVGMALIIEGRRRSR